MSNLEIYERVRVVPDAAKKSIQGGRLRGMTDINPMYRIKALTELFGPVGIGWYVEVVDKSIIEGASNEKIAVVDILLYVKMNEEWSKGIFGTGGSMFITNEKNGLYTSDEAFKMAYTDALSVSCKQLGIGADVYWEKDGTKYSVSNEVEKPQIREEKKSTKPLLTPKHSNWRPVVEWLSKKGNTIAKVEEKYHLPIDYREQLINESINFVKDEHI